ncbi:MAG TPA: PilN domain-containing protein [Bryobacteraceae bacterium]|nr:PilN domain-containing protein [Bryobacteraceae bacterium]
MTLPISKDFRKLLAFGSGVGIEIGAAELEVAVVRVRPTQIQVSGRLTVPAYATRPAAEWGAEYGRFLRKLGASHLGATVLLPRRDVIVRLLAFPGVAKGDMESAIRLQLDTLHPYGEEDVCWGWSPLTHGQVLVGIARRETVDRYAQLFNEAGVAISSFTFSAAAIHAAIALNSAETADGFLALSQTGSGAVEVYGESPARRVFSAQFESSSGRATALALAELRLAPETEPRALEEVLPKPALNPVENDLSRNALPYATALAGACPRLVPAANLLPVEYRRSVSRAMFIPTAALAACLLLIASAMAAYHTIADRRYLAQINAEIAQLEPQARHAAALDRQIQDMRSRSRLLDQFRGQTHGDLDALNELTRLVSPPAWTNSIDLTRDAAHISGEAPQAAPLIKLLDSSPFFDNSAFVVVTRSGSNEQFQIRTDRENRK